MKRDSNAPKRPLARYPGAKWRQADKILEWVPEDHDVCTVPFGGTMPTILRKPRSRMEVYNDKSEGMGNNWLDSGWRKYNFWSGRFCRQY